MRSLIVLYLYLIRLVFGHYHYNNPEAYVIPAPEIIVYSNGFSVAIPDEPGIEMFLFHGSLNSKTKLLQESSIVMSTRVRTGEKWFLQNNSTKPKIGGYIHYWLYVTKNGVAYDRPPEYYGIRDTVNRDNLKIENTDFTFKHTRGSEVPTIDQQTVHSHIQPQRATPDYWIWNKR